MVSLDKISDIIIFSKFKLKINNKLIFNKEDRDKYIDKNEQL
jgi:hypothetical protein